MGKSRENFVRLAEARTSKIIKMINSIGNLSNRSNYTYTKTDVDKIFSVVDEEVRKCRLRFISQLDSTRDIKFKL